MKKIHIDSVFLTWSVSFKSNQNLKISGDLKRFVSNLSSEMEAVFTPVAFDTLYLHKNCGFSFRLL